MKPHPRLVGPRFVAAKVTEPLRLFCIPDGFSQIAGIAMNHAGDMVGARRAGGENNRLLSGSQGIVVPTLTQANVTQRHVCYVAIRVDCQSMSRVLQCRFVGCPLVLLP